ncbi:MAG: DUF188 domain-containing protein [Faecalibacillus sp.]
MRLLIDGDGCPDRNEIFDLAIHYQIDTYLFIDYAHQIVDDRIHVVSCDIGKDSVDSMIIQFVDKGDIVITQDYGLASLLLMKDAIVLHVSGKRISQNNIHHLLQMRYIGYVTRKSSKHIRGPKKRTEKDKMFFLRELEKLLIDSREK